MKIKITDIDYIPIHLFSLNYRFTDEKYHKLSGSDLARIKPLNNQKSKEFNYYLSKFVDNYQLSPDEFEKIVSITEAHEDGNTSSWLKHIGADFEGEIIVSWDDENCVITDFSLFCNNWDDFCYPGPDDVIIISRNQKVCLYYNHEDVFQFGFKRQG